MKISFIEPHLKQYGGIRRIVELSNRLTIRGHDVAIFHSDGSTCKWLKCIAKTKRAEDVLTESHDVIIFNDPNFKDYKLAEQAKAKLKQNYILELYEKELINKFAFRKFLPRYQRIRVFDKIFSSKSFKHIANATWEQEWVKNNLGINAKKVLGGINKQMFHPIYDLKKENRNVEVLYSGDRRPAKGTKIIERAKELVIKQDPNISFSYYSGKNIPQDEMAEIYSKADIFIEASLRGGWNNPVAEAMACETAVICSDIGAVKDFALNDETAIVVPVNDYEGMANAILKLANNEELRTKLAKKGYERITKFDWEKTVDRLEEVIQEYLSENNI